METALQLFKIDIGLTSTARDELFRTLLEGYKADLEEKGLRIDLSDQQMLALLVDYSVWTYKHRNDDTAELPKNIQFRINNLKMRVRAGGEYNAAD